MKATANEDNSEKWEVFVEDFQDYALIDKTFAASLVRQMAKFRLIFSEGNRAMIRNLDIGPVQNDRLEQRGAESRRQLKLT